ncbi:hypothetical protein TNCV_5063901 [Trichonephila clavipes]|nr:hypothetical protein TNCV_5063901 [Trichonephila clavipes]
MDLENFKPQQGPSTSIDDDEPEFCDFIGDLEPKTRCKKPHTIAEELILPAAIEIVETVWRQFCQRVAVHTPIK